MQSLTACLAATGVCVAKIDPKEAAARLKAHNDAELARLNAEDRALKATRSRQECERRLGRACIPLAYKNAILTRFRPISEDQKKGLEVAQRFCRNFETHVKPQGLGILYYGPVGTGKSHLACAILHELSDRYTVLYTTTQGLIRGVRRGWDRASGMSETDALGQYIDVDILAMDEIGVQAGTDSERNIIFNVIDTRLSENRPTIFISNLPPSRLSNVLGDRIADRIKGKCFPALIAGESQRKPITLDAFGE